MESYPLIYIIIGGAALGMALLPQTLERRPLSYAIVYIILGALLFLFPTGLPDPDPGKNNPFLVRLTEIMVIVSIMGTALKIKKIFSFREWRVPLLLASLTMIISIGIITLISYLLLDFGLPESLLIGAVLAPTDPVLASDVQILRPSVAKKDEVRFSLTAEGGLNDGTAFPFTWLAIFAVEGVPKDEAEWIFEWIYKDLVYRLFAGIMTGVIIGKLLAYLIFKLPKKRFNFPEIREGYVALCATLLAYGCAEIIHGYGFLAVFFAGLIIANHEKGHEYHEESYNFIEQIEKMLMVIVLILLGGAFVSGLLSKLTWGLAFAGIAFILIVRPLSAYLATVKSGLSASEKWSISFFGIKGIGSLFYLSFAIKEAEFSQVETIWSFVGFIILASVVIHGITASPVMAKLEQKGKDKAADKKET